MKEIEFQKQLFIGLDKDRYSKMNSFIKANTVKDIESFSLAGSIMLDVFSSRFLFGREHENIILFGVNKALQFLEDNSERNIVCEYIFVDNAKYCTFRLSGLNKGVICAVKLQFDI